MITFEQFCAETKGPKTRANYEAAMRFMKRAQQEERFMKQYPCIGSKTKFHRGMCEVCRTEKAAFRLEIEYNYFRGDDDVFRACVPCSKLPVEEIITKCVLNESQHGIVDFSNNKNP